MSDSVTMDAGSDTAETTSTLIDTQSQDTSTSQSAPPTSKTYTEADLQRVLRGRIEQQKRSYEKQLAEYRTKQEQYDAVVQKMNSGIEQMGRGFGFIKDETPAPVTHESIQALERQFDQRLNQRLEEMQQRQVYNQIQGHWKDVEAKFADWHDVPGFKDAWAKQWEPNKDPMAIAANIVSAYEKKFAARANATAQNRDDRLRSAPVKPGGAVASPSKGEDKSPLRKQFLAAIDAARGN